MKDLRMQITRSDRSRKDYIFDSMPLCWMKSMAEWKTLASAATVHRRGKCGCFCCSALIKIFSCDTFRLFVTV